MLAVKIVQIGVVEPQIPTVLEKLAAGEKVQFKKRKAEITFKLELQVIPQIGSYLDAYYLSGIVEQVFHRINPHDNSKTEYIIQLEKNKEKFINYLNWENLDSSDNENRFEIRWLGDWTYHDS